MALLKLLRGLSSNLSTKVPLNDGNLIVTTDDEKLYCDVPDGDNIKRIQLNKTLDATYNAQEETLILNKE